MSAPEPQDRPDYNALLQTLADSHRSFVTPDNMGEFSYTRTYANPIDKRPIHVFEKADGSAVHLEDDGRLYTSNGPRDADGQPVETRQPRQPGEMSESMETLMRMRGSDAGRVDVLEGQPAPAQPLTTPDMAVSEADETGVDQVGPQDTEAPREP